MPTDACAFDLSAGFAAVEQGDDRMEPAATLHVGFSDFYASNAFYYGRTYGPVRQETFLLTAVRKWGLFKSNYLTAHFGLVLMDERTQLEYEQDAYKQYDEKNDAYNGGVDFGVGWSLPKSAGPLAFGVTWDSHVFPAGGYGGLLLATGRKQTLSVTMGVAF